MRDDPGDLAGAGALLGLIRAGSARTRAELSELTGMARSTVSQRIDALLASGLVREAATPLPTGGRPAASFAFNELAGVVLAADLGATHSRFAVCDLAGTALAERAEEMAVARGPEVVLQRVEDCFVELLDEARRDRADVRGVGIGVPGPVEFASGCPVNPPIMPGWDGYAIPGWFEHWLVPVLVDNDVNIMATGEHWTNHRGRDHLLFVKVGTGIGCGIIAGGRIHRGGQGAAGDIGHVRVAGHDHVVCNCGNTGCLEALAGGGAMARRLTELGYEAANGREVVGLVRAGNLEAVRLVRAAGRLIGEALAGVVNFFNPQVIVIGGDLADAHEQLFAGIREVVYRRSLPLATRHLQLRRSALGDAAGVTGAAVTTIEHVLSPAAVDRAVAAAATR